MMTCSHRGLHTAQGLVVESDAPFGLFRRQRRFGGEASLLVYPAPYPLDADEAKRLMAGLDMRPIPVRRGEEVSGSRPYAIGDVARDIHWRNSARTGRLMTKSFTTTASEAPVLTLGTAPQAEATLDDMVRLAAGLGQLWTRGGGQVRLHTGPQGRELGWGGLLRELALTSTPTLPPLSVSLRAIASGSNAVAIVSASDRAGIEGLLRAAPRMASLRVLLLTSTGQEQDSPANAVSTLEQAGARVSLFTGPLPAARREEKPSTVGWSSL
jgi:uncharacterized protein (DUF58 family)